MENAKSYVELQQDLKKKKIKELLNMKPGEWGYDLVAGWSAVKSAFHFIFFSAEEN